jgi:hypothetical protein
VTKQKSSQEWILLVHQLPAKPVNLRVRIWRKLQKLGAVAIKNSVYLLPANEKTHEDFQWLKQEIESAGGEAAVFRASTVEGKTNEEMITAFRAASDEQFAAIAAEFDGLAGAVTQQARGKHFSSGRLAAHEAELERLHTQLESIVANDFFSANGRAGALVAYRRCQKVVEVLRGPAAKESLTKAGVLDLKRYQGRRWLTRRHLHIDRLASAWLISQFIDRRPRFYFVADGETVKGAIPFDMYGAEFTHHGDECTFETLLKRFGLGDVKGLREIAEIVHDIDLKDEKFHRLEAAGLKAIVDGLSETLRNDRKLLRQASVIFDGLYALMSKPLIRKPASEKKSRRNKQSG